MFWFQLMYYWKWSQFWKNWESRNFLMNGLYTNLSKLTVQWIQNFFCCRICIPNSGGFLGDTSNCLIQSLSIIAAHQEQKCDEQELNKSIGKWNFIKTLSTMCHITSGVVFFDHANDAHHWYPYFFLRDWDNDPHNKTLAPCNIFQRVFMLLGRIYEFYKPVIVGHF